LAYWGVEMKRRRWLGPTADDLRPSLDEGVVPSAGRMTPGATTPASASPAETNNAAEAAPATEPLGPEQTSAPDGPTASLWSQSAAAPPLDVSPTPEAPVATDAAAPTAQATAAPESPRSDFLPPAPPLAAHIPEPRASHEPGPPSPERSGPWVRWGRWVAFGLCLVAGAAFAWDRNSWSDTPALGIVVGLVGAAVTVHLYGLLAWGVMRGIFRRRAWTYQRSTYSPLVLILVLLGMLGMPALRASHDDGGSSAAAAGDLRKQLDDAGRDAAAKEPDPVGQKLAGHSNQVSSSDNEHLAARAGLGVRFGTMLTRVLADYNDQKVTGEQWVASTRKRLAQADRAMSGLRRHTAAVQDTAMQRQLRRFDRVRSNALSAFRHLLSGVEGSDSAQVASATKLVNRRLVEYRAEGRRLMGLISPYLTQEELKLLSRAGGV
jgi:hypothetical protein